MNVQWCSPSMGMSLVIIEASLHTDHRVARDVTEYKVALVTFHCKAENPVMQTSKIHRNYAQVLVAVLIQIQVRLDVIDQLSY